MFAVFASHVGSNSVDQMPEICRVESENVEQQIAEKLRKENFQSRSGGKIKERKALRQSRGD